MINLNISAKIFNPIYLKYQINNNHRYQIYYGGASSGKSFSLAQRTILEVLQGHNYLIVRNTQTTIKRSVFNEITKAISNFKVSKYFNINKSDLIITCNLNNKQILFSGLDDVEKIKSVTPINGVIDTIWIEEATETEYKDYKQLDKRLRGRCDFPKKLIFSFNPILQDHWLYREFFDIWQDDKQYCENDTVSILKTTYKDNKFLTKDDIKALESETDKYYYDVYVCGKWGVLGGIVYKNWRVQEFDESVFENFRYGVDFGYNPDPTAFVKLNLDKKHKKIYICDEFEATELQNEDAAKIIIDKAGSNIVFCEAAEPRSIAELKKYKVNTKAAKKGPDSLDYGIKFVQGYEIIIHPRCKNFKREISFYKYKEDKNGDVLPIPVDKDNHCITGDTIINTLDGDIQIKDLVGKNGWLYCYDEENKQKTISEFYDVRMTRQQADIYKVTLDDGRVIKATADHLILTDNGWKQLIDLQENDKIIDINCQSH